MPDPAPDLPPHGLLGRALTGSRRRTVFGIEGGALIRWFFQGNALLSIVVLALITFTLFKEAKDFLPQNRRNLELYRVAGLEYVDIVRAQVSDYRELGRLLQDIRQEEVARLTAAGADTDAVQAKLAAFDAYLEKFDGAILPHEAFVSEWGELVTSLKDRSKVAADMEEARANVAASLPRVEGELAALRSAGAAAEEIAKKEAQLAAMRADYEEKAAGIEKVDFATELKAVTDKRPDYLAANAALVTAVGALATSLPEVPDAEIAARLQRFGALLARVAAEAPDYARRLEAWRADKPVSLGESFTAFAFGRDWITASFWQDWYGILPLFTGSFLIAVLALAIAIPFGVASAVYVNQVATPAEARLVKPTIEFIAAIPSVVLGFFGIAVLGETLRWVSQLPGLGWLPGFPMQERLTALTAGCLLGLMAVPTIFSLAEDAINNVPRAFKEASLALGATRLQTIVRIIVPAALSGILAAVLLGLGRVIGETMVVLLCAGNRIEIPEFSSGLGAFLQPVHTMTGIIAQEMGEVVRGSIHYRALFMVGCVLFLLSMGINYTAQVIVRRYKITGG